MPDAAALERTRAACQEALEGHPDLAPLWTACRRGQPELHRARALLPRVRTYGDEVSHLGAIKRMLAGMGYPVENGAFERLLIVAAANDSIAALPRLPVDPLIVDLFCQNFQRYAAMPPALPEPFDLARASFIAMGRMAALTRFPAGQLDWEISGVPRSWVLRGPWRSRLRLLEILATTLHGSGPAYFSHLNPNRRNQAVLLERESLKSYHRMARSMARQPHIKGLVTASWLHSPDTFAVSPHLAWLNKVFLDNGGYVLPLGPVEADCGVLYRSPERQVAFDAGTFKPTEALVIWPRDAMLEWAAGHDELRDDRVHVRPPLKLQEASA